MASKHVWLGALFFSIPFAFAGCGDDEDDDGGGDGKTGGRGGSTGGSVTGGRSGAGMGGTTTGGRGGTSGRGGQGGTTTGGSAGEGGFGGDDGGMGGDDGGMGGEPQGGSAGAGMGGTGGGGAGSGGLAGGGVGGAGSGGLAGGGVGGAGAGGLAGGGTAGGGMAGAGGAFPLCDPAAPEVFVGVLSGAAEVPPITSSGTGVAVAELNAAETQLTVSASWSGMTSDTTIGHIHGPAAANVGGAPVIFDLMPPATDEFGQVIGRTFAISPTQVADLKQSLYYANIHSATNGGGELRAQLVPAAMVRSWGALSASQETGSPVTSSATGRSFVATLPGNTQAAVLAIWSGLTTNTYNGHVHGPAAPGASAGAIFPFFASPSPPGATTSGSIVMLWTLGTGHFEAVRDSLSYTNIHSTMYMNGEIRGQLLPPCP